MISLSIEEYHDYFPTYFHCINFICVNHENMQGSKQSITGNIFRLLKLFIKSESFESVSCIIRMFPTSISSLPSSPVL